MAKFFLSTLLILLAAARCDAHANNISDEYLRMRNIDSKTLVGKGMKFIEKNRSDSALVFFYAVANRYYTGQYGKNDLPYIIKAFEDIGIIYMTYIYDYEKSYDNLLQARELAERNNLTKRLPNIYNCIANILQMSKQSDSKTEKREVMGMLKKSFYAAVKNGDRHTMALAMNNMLSTGEWKSGENLGIEKEIKTFEKLCSSDKDPRSRRVLMQCNAYTQLRKGNDEAATRIIESMIRANGNYPLAYRGVLIDRSIIAKIYRNKKQYAKAVEYMKESLGIARRNNGLDYESSICNDISDTYRLMGDSANEQKYELLHLRLKERLTTDGNLASARNAEFLRELNKANEQVKNLSEKRRRQNIMLTCAVIAIAIIAALLWRIYRANIKIRQNYKHLYRTNVELLANESEARQRKTAAEEEIKRLKRQLLGNGNGTPRKTAEEKHDETASEQLPEKYKGSRMTQEETKELYAMILKIMGTSDEIFRLGFTIDRLSEIVHSRSRYVSQAINQESGSNFNTLLNEYRIKEACRRLSGNPGYANMTIEAIAESVGFKSRTSFGALFKTMTGLSPSAYQKMARMENEE